jgi:hypothetical protein
MPRNPTTNPPWRELDLLRFDLDIRGMKAGRASGMPQFPITGLTQLCVRMEGVRTPYFRHRRDHGDEARAKVLATFLEVLIERLPELR